jgi:hypothetical protein
MLIWCKWACLFERSACMHRLHDDYTWCICACLFDVNEHACLKGAHVCIADTMSNKHAHIHHNLNTYAFPSIARLTRQSQCPHTQLSVCVCVWYAFVSARYICHAMHVYMYVCMYVCMYVYIYIYMYMAPVRHSHHTRNNLCVCVYDVLLCAPTLVNVASWIRIYSTLSCTYTLLIYTIYNCLYIVCFCFWLVSLFWISINRSQMCPCKAVRARAVSHTHVRVSRQGI